jgi:hypothetical protein
VIVRQLVESKKGGLKPSKWAIKRYKNSVGGATEFLKKVLKSE